MPSPVKYLEISSKLPRQGEAVIAVSNPRGLSGTVTDGIVSAFRDNNSWIQFTASVSPGSSGGALINLKGEVIGMITANLKGEGQNLNFAIAPEILTKFLSAAINKPSVYVSNSKKHKEQAILSTPKTTKTKPRQDKILPKTKNTSKGSGIPLPDAKGFLVHKWGCSVESIRKYVSSPLKDIDNTGKIYTTGRSFKAFNAKINTVVYYIIYGGKLGSIIFAVNDNRHNAELETLITAELTMLYGKHSDDRYDKSGESLRIWNTDGLKIILYYHIFNDVLFVNFSPKHS